MDVPHLPSNENKIIEMPSTMQTDNSPELKLPQAGDQTNEPHTIYEEDKSEDLKTMRVGDIKTMNRIDFLKYQKKMLHLERNTEIERETMKTVNIKGEGVPGVLNHLQVDSCSSTRFGRFCATFSSFTHPTLTPHGLRKGDNVSIYYGGAGCRPENHCIDGVLFDVNAIDLTITIDKKFTFEENSYSIKHYPSIENIKRMLSSLSDMEEVRGPGQHLVSVLFKEAPIKDPLLSLPPRICRYEHNIANLFNKKLDESQQLAVNFVLRQKDISVIHGPPGTGKTTTLIEIIRQHVRMKTKVLALAPSNLGVDNLVERLDGVGLSVIRIGHPARTTEATQRHTVDALLHSSDNRHIFEDINDEIKMLRSKLAGIPQKDRRPLYKEVSHLRKELQDRQEKQTRELIKKSDVVLCTLLSAHKGGILRHLKDDHFGLTVIDECSQGTEVSCYPAVLRSTKLLLAGDHKQLPPTVLCNEASGMLTSLMERVIELYGDRVVRMLSVQYRMHASIMRWSSAVMYHDQLVAHESVKGHLLCDMPHITATEDTNVPLILIDTSDCPGFEENQNSLVEASSRWNDGEAELVLAHVKKLIGAGVKQEQVAVITPYARQVKTVRSLVFPDFPGVEVQTVDGFQGREKDIVILSLVRSNDKGDIGFLAEDRRLNVAVTRARRHLAVVCNTGTLQRNHFLKSFVEYMMENATVVRAENMDEEICVKRNADYRDIDLSELLQTDVKEIQVEKTEQEITLEKEIRELKKKEKYRTVLQKFLQSNNWKHRFTSKISSYDRLMIHDIAESLGLHHYSEGVDEKRHIVIAKQQRKYDDKELQQHEVPDQTCAEVASRNLHAIPNTSESDSNEHTETEKVEVIPRLVQPLTKHCTLCGKNIPEANFTVHRASCEKKENEAIALQEKKRAAKKSEAKISSAQEQCRQISSAAATKKKNKSKKSSSSDFGGADDDDFDAIVTSFSASHQRCNYSKCSGASLKLLLQVCPWCHTTYCLQHHLAEAHGCGRHAKQHARATVLREGVVYPGSGVPSKLPHPDKRAQLSRALDKKITAKEQDRKKLNKKK